MPKNLDNCFYCQSLRTNSQVNIGHCAFCGAKSKPLYPVIYQGNKKLFCCGCSWWQFPKSEQEKQAENKWYQEWRKTN